MAPLPGFAGSSSSVSSTFPLAMLLMAEVSRDRNTTPSVASVTSIMPTTARPTQEPDFFGRRRAVATGVSTTGPSKSNGEPAASGAASGGATAVDAIGAG